MTRAREVKDKYFRDWLEAETQRIRLRFNGEVDRARPTGPTTWSIDRIVSDPDEPLRFPLIEYRLEPASSDTFIIHSHMTLAGESYAQAHPEFWSVFFELEARIDRCWPARFSPNIVAGVKPNATISAGVVETGESVGEPCPGQPGDSPPRAPTL